MQASLIQQKIKQAILSDSRWIVVHSSLFHLNLDQKYILAFKWEFLKAIRSLSNEGYQLAFPAFTFSFTKTGVFHKRLPSEVGVLSDWVSELLGAKRTNHPIYSHVLLGGDVDQAIKFTTESCFNDKSIYQFFEQQNATIMMLGCDWSYCTSFHYFEQQFSVPYRYHKTFHANDDSMLVTSMYVRNEKFTVKNDFSMWIAGAQETQKIYSTPFAQGILQSVTFNDLSQQCKKDLSHSLVAYVQNPVMVARQISNQQQANDQDVLKIAILAESNYEPWSDVLKQTFAQVLPGYRVELTQNKYGQMANDVLSGDIGENCPDFCFLPSRLEDLLHLTDMQFTDYQNEDAMHAVIDGYVGLINQLAKHVNRLVFVSLFSENTVTLGQSALAQTSSKRNELHVSEVVAQFNQYLKHSLERLTNVRLLPVESLGLSQYFDSRLWYLGKIPYSIEGFIKLADHYVGLVAHECGASTRLLILDLDNTLWGGVLGEDGIDGIQLGGDFPGNAFKDFQRAILALHNRGIALALASKNDQSLALTTIENHPDMLIKEQHLATYRIDWNEKAVNIQSMAEELGLSLSNVMFVDDNALECEKVRKLCPEVKVIELPNDPVDYVSTMMSSRYLKIAQATVEDGKRAKGYVQQRQSKAKAEQYQNLDDYFASLNIAVCVEPVNETSFNRAVQLSNKTNQFNTTTQRFSDKSLKNLLNRDDYQLVTISYQDSATEREIIGLLITKYTRRCCDVELLLLSCRVLGRSIETAMLSWLEQQCLSKNIAYIQGEINLTERNTPVRDIYSRHDFIKLADNKWQFNVDPLGKKLINVPKWMRVIV